MGVNVYCTLLNLIDELKRQIPVKVSVFEIESPPDPFSKRLLLCGFVFVFVFLTGKPWHAVGFGSMRQHGVCPRHIIAASQPQVRYHTCRPASLLSLSFK